MFLIQILSSIQCILLYNFNKPEFYNSFLILGAIITALFFIIPGYFGISDNPIVGNPTLCFTIVPVNTNSFVSFVIVGSIISGLLFLEPDWGNSGNLIAANHTLYFRNSALYLSAHCFSSDQDGDPMLTSIPIKLIVEVSNRHNAAFSKILSQYSHVVIESSRYNKTQYKRYGLGFNSHFQYTLFTNELLEQRFPLRLFSVTKFSVKEDKERQVIVHSLLRS